METVPGDDIVEHLVEAAADYAKAFDAVNVEALKKDYHAIHFKLPGVREALGRVESWLKGEKTRLREAQTAIDTIIIFGEPKEESK